MKSISGAFAAALMLFVFFPASLFAQEPQLPELVTDRPDFGSF